MKAIPVSDKTRLEILWLLKLGIPFKTSDTIRGWNREDSRKSWIDFCSDPTNWPHNHLTNKNLVVYFADDQHP